MSPVEIPLGPDMVLETKQFVLWITIPILVSVYFMPAIVAMFRKHMNQLAIFLLNVFAGWTFLGWIAALVWAGTSNTAKIKANG